MDRLGLSLLLSAGLIAVLHIGLRALIVHAVDLRAHHPERYTGAWRALGDLVPSAKIESLRTTILATVAAVAIVIVVAASGALDSIARSPEGAVLEIVVLAVITIAGLSAAFVVSARARAGAPTKAEAQEK